MPQTIEDLGQKVKAKYPGTYDDLSDADVGQKVKVKFPGAYDDFVDVPSGTGPLPGMPAAPIPHELQPGNPDAQNWSAPQLPNSLRVLQPAVDAVNAGANSGIKHLAGVAATVLPSSWGGDAARQIQSEIPEPSSLPERAGSFAENMLEMGKMGGAGESLAAKAGEAAPGIVKSVLPYVGQAAGTAAAAKMQGGSAAAAAIPALAIPAAFGAAKSGARMLLEKLLASPANAKLGPEAIAFAQKAGIPLDQGAITGSRGVQALQKMLGETVAPDKYASLVEGQQTGLNKAANAFTNGGDTTPYEGGQAVIDALKNKVQDLHVQGGHAYDKFESLSQNAAVPTVVGSKTSSILDAAGRPITTPVTQSQAFPVDVSKVKAGLKPMYDKITQSLAALPEMQRQTDPGYRLFSRLMNGPDQIPARDAEDLLSLLKSVGRDTALPEMRNRSQGIAAVASKLLQPAVDSSVNGASPEAYAALESGRNLWRNKYQVANLLDSLGGADAAHQVSAFKKLTAPLDSQYDNLKQVLTTAPEVTEPLKRAYLGNLFERSTENGGFTRADSAMANWRKLGPKTKAALFGDQSKDIDTFLTLAQRLNQNPNPSGTGTINSLIRLGLAVAHPVSAGGPILFSRKLASVLYSPEGAQNLRALVRSGVRSPVGQKAEAALSTMLSGATSRAQSTDQYALGAAQ